MRERAVSLVVTREREPCGCAGERERTVYVRGERFDWSSEQECVGMRVAGERERARAQVLIMSTWDIDLFVNSQINFLSKVRMSLSHYQDEHTQ